MRVCELEYTHTRAIGANEKDAKWERNEKELRVCTMPMTNEQEHSGEAKIFHLPRAINMH